MNGTAVFHEGSTSRVLVLCFHLALFPRPFKFPTGIVNESVKSVCPSRTRCYRSRSVEEFFVETVAGDGRSQDCACNFHTYSTLVTQYEYSLHTVWHSKYSAWLPLSGIFCIPKWHVTRRMLHIRRTGKWLPVCACHCDPTNLRTLRSSRDTPHRLAYS
jgi:hypothetical protein